MKQTRKKHSPAFKAKVALAALQGFGLSLMTGEESKGLDVDREIFWSASHPSGGSVLQRYRIIRSVHFNDWELA